MRTSESVKNISLALLKAQKAMGGAVKGASNPYFKSKYSDYNSVLEVVKEPLNEAGLIVLQPTIVRDGKTLVETTIIHAESGEYLTSEMEVVTAKDRDPQAYGSAITYARRYSLQSMLSIPSVDDDAEASMTRPSSTKSTSSSSTSATASAPATIVAAKSPATVTEITKSRTSFRQPPKPATTTEPTDNLFA